VLLHGLDVYVIVEVDDVLSLAIPDVDLHVDVHHGFAALGLLRVLVDDLIELDLHIVLYLAHSVDSAHDHLVQLPIDQELWL